MAFVQCKAASNHQMFSRFVECHSDNNEETTHTQTDFKFGRTECFQIFSWEHASKQETGFCDCEVLDAFSSVQRFKATQRCLQRLIDEHTLTRIVHTFLSEYTELPHDHIETIIGFLVPVTSHENDIYNVEVWFENLSVMLPHKWLVFARKRHYRTD